jgi:hypothetical protein
VVDYSLASTRKIISAQTVIEAALNIIVRTSPQRLNVGAIAVNNLTQNPIYQGSDWMPRRTSIIHAMLLVTPNWPRHI